MFCEVDSNHSPKGEGRFCTTKYVLGGAAKTKADEIVRACGEVSSGAWSLGAFSKCLTSGINWDDQQVAVARSSGGMMLRSCAETPTSFAKKKRNPDFDVQHTAKLHGSMWTWKTQKIVYFRGTATCMCRRVRNCMAQASASRSTFRVQRKFLRPSLESSQNCTTLLIQNQREDPEQS